MRKSSTAWVCTSLGVFRTFSPHTQSHTRLTMLVLSERDLNAYDTYLSRKLNTQRAASEQRITFRANFQTRNRIVSRKNQIYVKPTAANVIIPNLLYTPREACFISVGPLLERAPRRTELVDRTRKWKFSSCWKRNEKMKRTWASFPQ